MKTRYAVINTMNAVQSDSIGTVISKHYSFTAAQKASEKLQRLTRAGNGSNSYLPLIIVRLTTAHPDHYIANHQWADLTDEETNQ